MTTPTRKRMRLFFARRAFIGLGIFAGGLLAAGTFTTSVPAAPRDVCLPIVGCVTTTLPTVSVPTVTVPTIPPVTVPIPPTTTTGTGTTTTPGSGGSTTPSSPPAAGDPGTAGSSPDAEPTTAFAARATVRVRGSGRTRVVEIRLRLSKPARLSALLSRNGKALARKQANVRAGSTLVRIRLARSLKAGLARLVLTYRSVAGESLRSNIRLRLPR